MKTPVSPTPSSNGDHPLLSFLPERLRSLKDVQKDVPRLAKDPALTAEIERVIPHIPTSHDIYRQDSREMRLPPGSVHLVLTSPPYWTLKEYNKTDGQLGHIADYEQFLAELDRVWRKCQARLSVKTAGLFSTATVTIHP